MTGPDHYREAEKILEQTSLEDHYRNYHLQAAQVHATLALAAATALSHYSPETGLTDADRRAWYVAASEGPGEKQRQREAKAAELAELAEFAAEDRELAKDAGTEKS